MLFSPPTPVVTWIQLIKLYELWDSKQRTKFWNDEIFFLSQNKIIAKLILTLRGWHAKYDVLSTIAGYVFHLILLFNSIFPVLFYF